LRSTFFFATTTSRFASSCPSNNDEIAKLNVAVTTAVTATNSITDRHEAVMPAHPSKP
jgi:hypothetical protein